MHDIGTLGGSCSYGLGINDLGQITGEADTDNYDTYGNQIMHAFFYSARTDMEDLGTLLGDSKSSSASGINDSGQVVGQYDTGTYDINGLYEFHAFLYTPGIGMQDLGNLLGDNKSSSANGINGSGQVVGGYYIGTYDPTENLIVHAYRYGARTGMKDLGTLIGGSENSVGVCINDFGQFTGDADTGTYDPTGMPMAHAFLNSARTGVKDLGTLGGLWSYGLGINNSGQVVGYSSIAPVSGSFHAFLYSNGNMIDLNTLIDPSSGWTLQSGQGINDLGQITGYGVINGQTHAFLMTPVMKKRIFR